MTSRRVVPLAAALVVASAAVLSVVGAGTADARDARSAGSSATVLAAASLASVVPALEPDARASFGGSNQLATQIRQGFPFDVYLSASPVYTQALAQEGLVRKPVAFATNSLVLIVPRANPARIAKVADLARRPKLRLVVSGPTVPIGLYTREVLKRLGLLRVLRKTVSLESDVKGVVAKVALGEADAGFVYETDARTVAAKVKIVRFPAVAQPDVVYEAALAARPRDREAAQAFLIALLGPEGRRALRAAGFGLPD